MGKEVTPIYWGTGCTIFRVLSLGLARSTQLSYSSGWRTLLSFCMQFGIYNEDLGILPASEIAILRIIAYAALFNKPSTMKSYLLAVRSLHVVNGSENPFENKPRIQLVLRGIKPLTGNRWQLRCPITPELLLVIRSRLNLSLYDHCLLWASCCLHFLAFLGLESLRSLPRGLAVIACNCQMFL